MRLQHQTIVYIACALYCIVVQNVKTKQCTRTQQFTAGLKDGKGVEFNGHVQPGAQGKSPDKVQPKDVTPAAESRTQVAVNSGGKTNEATKQGKEPLKQGQDKPTAKQKEKQEKAQDKSLKADKPKKSRGMKM